MAFKFRIGVTHNIKSWSGDPPFVSAVAEFHETSSIDGGDD